MLPIKIVRIQFDLKIEKTSNIEINFILTLTKLVVAETLFNQIG